MHIHRHKYKSKIHIGAAKKFFVVICHTCGKVSHKPRWPFWREL